MIVYKILYGNESLDLFLNLIYLFCYRMLVSLFKIKPLYGKIEIILVIIYPYEISSEAVCGNTGCR